MVIFSKKLNRKNKINKSVYFKFTYKLRFAFHKRFWLFARKKPFSYLTSRENKIKKKNKKLKKIRRMRLNAKRIKIAPKLLTYKIKSNRKKQLKKKLKKFKNNFSSLLKLGLNLNFSTFNPLILIKKEQKKAKNITKKRFLRKKSIQYYSLLKPKRINIKKNKFFNRFDPKNRTRDRNKYVNKHHNKNYKFRNNKPKVKLKPIKKKVQLSFIRNKFQLKAKQKKINLNEIPLLYLDT